MARLYRPHIPLSVRIKVVARQLGQRGLSELVQTTNKTTGTWGEELHILLSHFAAASGCTLKDLRLDHDPALGVRRRAGEGKETVYDPPANHPWFLNYRPHGTEFEGSHDVKTRIRGDNGQYSDLMLIKRQKRREEKRPKNPGQKYWNMKRKLQSRSQFAKGRKLQSASRWAKGRKLGKRG